MDRMQQRFERFAELRAGNPNADFEELMMRIHDEEQEADERAHYEMLASLDEERANAA